MLNKRLLAILAGLAGLICTDAMALPETAPDHAKLKPIYQEKSLYRNILVLEGDGHRCMTFGRFHGLQSCMNLKRPDLLVFNYTKALLAAFLAVPKPSRVLMIGLGAGSVPKAIRSLYPHTPIDVVELDPAVARVASSHFGFVPDSQTHVVVDDGRVFVRKQKRAAVRYDVILVDAFEKDYIPEHMLTREFLQEVKSILNPGGIVAANTFAKGAMQRHESATYQAVFGDISDITMEGGNRILLARAEGQVSKDLLQRHASLFDQSLLPLGFSPDDLLTTFKPQVPVKDVRVLTDQFSPANLLQAFQH